LARTQDKALLLQARRHAAAEETMLITRPQLYAVRVTADGPVAFWLLWWE